MAKTSAKNGILLVDGYNLSTYGRSYEIAYENSPIEVTGFGDGWTNYIPGLVIGKMGCEFLYDEAAGKSLAALKPHISNKQVTIVPDGYVLGNPVFAMTAMQGTLTPQGNATSAVSLGTVAMVGYGADAGPLPGWCLQHGTITNTTTGTGFVDPSAGAVTQRCAGILHIWQACAADTYVVKIQHSANLGGPYVDLVTFSLNGSAIGSERVNVASGVINQYRRVLATRTGAAGNTFGFTVSFWHAGNGSS